MLSIPIFSDVVSVPGTEGIKYVGSKRKLIPYILEMANQVKAETVLDGFSGTTRVSQAFAQQGYKVVCNDISAWSEVFGVCYLSNNGQKRDYQELLQHLNSLSPIDGWFTEHYGGWANGGCSVQENGLKKPWQIHNTRKLDAIREEIERLDLNKTDKSVALTSLILALDQVDNCLGHYVSYLKNWSPRSYKNLTLKIPRLFNTLQEHKVRRADIFDAISDVEVDIAYFDPPYGSNNEKMPASRVRYGSYYHLWSSVCLYDKPFLFGKSNRRQDTSDEIAASVFEDFRKDKNNNYVAVRAIENLIQKTKAKWIILSYSSGGRATAEELNNVIQRNGNLLDVVEIEHRKNVMSGMQWTGEWLREAEKPNKEFLFLIEK